MFSAKSISALPRLSLAPPMIEKRTIGFTNSPKGDIAWSIWPMTRCTVIFTFLPLCAGEIWHWQFPPMANRPHSRPGWQNCLTDY